MNIDVDVQRMINAGPSNEDIQQWVEAVLKHEQHDDAEVTIRIVDEVEITQLNEEYRNKQGVTNVLSFPFECPAEVELNLLGDLVICAAVVAREAEEQGKTEIAHWTHMIVHGMLHLLGYDHIEEAEAEQMEQHEIAVLAQFGYANPY